MSIDELRPALRAVELGTDLAPVAEKLVRLVEKQRPSVRGTGKRIPSSRHLEILSFRDARDPSLTTRVEGWEATLTRLKRQQNDILLFGVDVVPLQFVVHLDAETGSVVGVYSHPMPHPSEAPGSAC